MSAAIKSTRVRRTLATLGMSAAMVGGVAGVAEAAQGGATAPAGNHYTYSTVARVTKAAQEGDIGPGGHATYKTWFWGRTEVCIKNTGSEDAGFTWSSATSSSGGGLESQQETCFVRSFVGFPITINNLSPRTSFHVRFPIGP